MKLNFKNLDKSPISFGRSPEINLFYKTQLFKLPSLEMYHTNNKLLNYRDASILGGNLAIIQNNILYPGGYSYSRNWANYDHYKKVDESILLEKVNTHKKKLLGKTLVLGIASHYGHFYVDFLDRNLDSNIADYDHYIIDQAHQFFFDWLDFFKISLPKKNIISLGFNKIINAEYIDVFSGSSIKPFWSPHTINLIEKILPLTDVQKNKIIFITRENAKERTFVNLDDVKKEFMNDFEFIDTGILSIAQQAMAFQKSSLIIGPIGSDLFNLVFATEHTRVICIISKKYAEAYGDNIKMINSLCFIKNIRIIFLISDEETDKKGYKSDLKIDIKLLQKLLP